MRSQRGIATGWLYLIGLIVVLGLVSGIVYGVKSYLDGVDAKGYQRGKEETEATYAKRDNKQLQTALGEVARLTKEKEALERAHASRVSAIDRKRQQEMANAKKQHESDLAAARSGSLVLRDPGGRTACPPVGGQGLRPPAGAGTGQRDGETGSQLSPAASGFLLGLVNEADDVARQLADAQALIEEQIRTCNTP